MTFFALSDDVKKKLWKHQISAIEFAINRLNNQRSPCLIRMPTGTGKTGIIACLSRLSNPGSTLILTPWAHLRDQMVNDVDSGFWQKIEFEPRNIDVKPLFPSTADEILKSKESIIVVATFATLTDLRINRPEIYKKLSVQVSLVIVDEGHYEPAVEWGKSVKGLQVKTVLLTATPYRNDLKLFRITNPDESTYHYFHKNAVEQGIIRDLKIVEINSPTSTPELTNEFITVWNNIKNSNSLPLQSPRAIICCDTHLQIETVVDILRGAGINAIGIHEQFENRTESYLHRHVPNAKNSDAEIWVHQYKLTEGLDDYRFCCVVLFTRFRNDRRLIQQVGRALRRGTETEDKPALLISPIEYSIRSGWEAYLEYETNLKLLDPQHFRDVVDKVLQTQPSVEYFDGRFRKRFSPPDLNKNSQVIINPSVIVRTPKSGFSLDEYIEDCTDTLNIEDAVILGPNSNSPCQKGDNYALWVYASIQNSRFLQTTSLYEIRLEVHCIVVAGGYVFITDSRGIFPEEYLEDHTFSVPSEVITRFLDKEFLPTHVSINSSLPYDTVIRGANLRGQNLLKIPASLTDRIQILRSIRGSSKKDGRRYIGLNNGRIRKEVSEEYRQKFDLSSYIHWITLVSQILNSNHESNMLFDRYMPTCNPPIPTIPRTICFDVMDLSFIDGSECKLKKSCYDLAENQTANGTIYKCTLEFENGTEKTFSTSLQVTFKPEKQRFWFTKDSGISIIVNQNDNNLVDKSLIEFINQRQEYVLIGLDGGNIVYQDRNFYKIDYAYAEQSLLGLIERPPSLACSTEKGTREQVQLLQTTHGTQFPNDSLFKLIAEGTLNLPFEVEVLICDDMGTECADFVAVNFSNHQLALIHAKVGSGDQISASSFHDVTAQAMKNLTFLTRNSEAPNKVGSWRKNGYWHNTRIPRLVRLPDGLPTAQTLWKKIMSEIIFSSNPDLYVILATSGCCEKPVLERAISIPTFRTPEVAQMLHLIDGLNGYARQNGVKVKIFDVPFQN